MKISMNIRYVLFGLFCVGAAPLCGMETPAPSKYKLECERVFKTDFDCNKGFLDTNISAARAVICMGESEELTESAIDKAFKKRQAMFSGDKVQNNQSDYQFSELIIRELANASDLLKAYIKQISLRKLILAAITSEDSEAGDAARLDLPEMHSLRFLLNPYLTNDEGDCFSNRAEYITANFSQNTHTLQSMLTSCSAVTGWSSLKTIFMIQPELWALSIFDKKCNSSLMLALCNASDKTLVNIDKNSPKYAKKLAKFREATEWIFKPWWVPYSVKLQYYQLTGIEAPKNEKIADQENDGKAEVLEQPQAPQEPFSLKIQQKPLCIDWQERKKKVRPAAPVLDEGVQLPVIALGYTPLDEIGKKCELVVPEPKPFSEIQKEEPAVKTTLQVPLVGSIIPGATTSKTARSQVSRIVIEAVDNKPKAPHIAPKKGLATHFWELAWKRPVVACGVLGAVIFGGYYAVKNNLFSNWLGRARSSFGSGLGNIPQRR